MLDPQAKQFLRMLESLDAPPLEFMELAEARASASASSQAIGPAFPVGEIRNLTAPGPAGAIPLRLYRPDTDKPCPALVYLHGGGWVLGDIPTHERFCTEIVNGAGCAVVSVDYRLAPEQFPHADAAYRAMLSLPLFTAMRDAEQDRVIAALHALLG